MQLKYTNHRKISKVHKPESVLRKPIVVGFGSKRSRLNVRKMRKIQNTHIVTRNCQLRKQFRSVSIPINMILKEQRLYNMLDK